MELIKRAAAFLLFLFSPICSGSPQAAAGKAVSGPEYLNWLEAARNGDPEKEYLAGLAFYQGAGGAARDYGKAFDWFARSARHGNSAACVKLGDMYGLGQGAAKDAKKAFDWYLKAARAGNAEGKEKLGDAYLDGKSVGENYAEAARWYADAAQTAAAPEPAFKLARLYYLGGPGLKRDEAKAQAMFIKAFDAGEPDAAPYLSGIFADRGDYAQAGQWLLKGAEKGGKTAMFDLAKAYLRIDEYSGKKLVPASAANAYKWLCVLTKKEYQPRFDELLKRTASQLTEKERKTAELEAAPLISRLVGQEELKRTSHARKAKQSI
jgi:hypothetical protein